MLGDSPHATRLLHQCVAGTPAGEQPKPDTEETLGKVFIETDGGEADQYGHPVSRGRLPFRKVERGQGIGGATQLERRLECKGLSRSAQKVGFRIDMQIIAARQTDGDGSGCAVKTK